LHTILPATADRVQHETLSAFAASRDRFERIVGWLEGPQAGRLAHGELEERLDVEGRELLRQMLQDHLDVRAQREPRLEAVVGADGMARGSVEAGHGRGLLTMFGKVEVARLAYRRRGHANLHPADAVLNLPVELHSHGLRRLAVLEGTRGSFDDVREAVRRRTGQRLGKRQLETLVQRAADDFDAFYAERKLIDFLSDWLERLAAAPRDWLRYRGRTLLVEAARLHSGIDGLADVARASVADLPQLVLDWVDALEDDGREDDGMAACREGLERIATGGAADEVRAQLADRLAVMGGRRGLLDVTLDARRIAWCSGPSQRRLLELVAAADQLGVTREVIAAEADQPDRCGNPRLACAVRPDAARDRARWSRCWTPSDHHGGSGRPDHSPANLRCRRHGPAGAPDARQASCVSRRAGSAGVPTASPTPWRRGGRVRPRPRRRASWRGAASLLHVQVESGGSGRLAGGARAQGGRAGTALTPGCPGRSAAAYSKVHDLQKIERGA